MLQSANSDGVDLGQEDPPEVRNEFQSSGEEALEQPIPAGGRTVKFSDADDVREITGDAGVDFEDGESEQGNDSEESGSEEDETSQSESDEDEGGQSSDSLFGNNSGDNPWDRSRSSSFVSDSFSSSDDDSGSSSSASSSSGPRSALRRNPLLGTQAEAFVPAEVAEKIVDTPGRRLSIMRRRRSSLHFENEEEERKKSAERVKDAVMKLIEEEEQIGQNRRVAGGKRVEKGAAVEPWTILKTKLEAILGVERDVPVLESKAARNTSSASRAIKREHKTTHLLESIPSQSVLFMPSASGTFSRPQSAMLAPPPPAALLQRRSSRALIGLPTIVTPQPPPPPPLTPSLLHGFLLSRNLSVPHPPLIRVLPVANPDLTLVLDSTCARAYRGLRVAAHVGFKVDDPGADGAVEAGREAGDVVGWCWAKARRCVVGVTKTMCIKTFDPYLRPLSSTPLRTPALHITAVEEASEFIVGGVGSLSIWGWGGGDWSTSPNQPLSARLHINDLDPDEWCTTSVFCSGGFHASSKESHTNGQGKPGRAVHGRIYVVVGGDVIVYSYNTGVRIERLTNITDGTIAALAWYEPFGYLCVGGTEGRIKILDPLNHVVHNLFAHQNGVTSMVVPFPEGTPKIPLLVSGGKDGVVRCWSLETGREVYNLQFTHPVLSMTILSDRTLSVSTTHSLSTYSFSLFHRPFVSLLSRPTLLRRIELPEGSVSGVAGPTRRLLVVTDDGTARMTGTVDGRVLYTAFPVLQNDGVVGSTYDMKGDRLYNLLSGGDLAVYEARMHPMKLVNEWKRNHYRRERSTCISTVTPPSIDNKPTLMWPVCGTSDGQLLLIDISKHGRHEPLVQAHTAAICHLFVEPRFNMIFTCGRDSLLRCFKIVPYNGEPRPSDGFKMPFLVEHAFTTTIPAGDVSLIASSEKMGVVFVSVGGTTLTIPYHPVSGFGAPYKHSRDDDHAGRVTHIAVLDNLGLFATSSMDGTVKIWTRECALVRDVQFNEPVTAVEFLNSRADLVVGLTDGVNIVKCQDYLPKHVLLMVLRQHHDDDPTEVSPVFEPGQDFINYYQSGYREKSELQKRTHAGTKVDRMMRRRERALDEVIQRKLADIEKMRDNRVQQIYQLIESYKLLDTSIEGDSTNQTKSRFEDSLFLFTPNPDRPREPFQYSEYQRDLLRGLGEWIKYTEEELIEKAREYRRLLKKKLARRGTLTLGFVPDLVHDGNFMEEMMKKEKSGRRRSSLHPDLLTEEELSRLIQKHDPNMDTEDRRRLLTQLHKMANEEEARIARQKRAAAEKAEKLATSKTSAIMSRRGSTEVHGGHRESEVLQPDSIADDGGTERKHRKRRHSKKTSDKTDPSKNKRSRRKSSLPAYEVTGSTEGLSLSNPSLAPDNRFLTEEMKRRIDLARKLRLRVESKFKAMGISLPNAAGAATVLRNAAASAKQRPSMISSRKLFTSDTRPTVADDASSAKLKDYLLKRRQQRREKTPEPNLPSTVGDDDVELETDVSPETVQPQPAVVHSAAQEPAPVSPPPQPPSLPPAVVQAPAPEAPSHLDEKGAIHEPPPEPTVQEPENPVQIREPEPDAKKDDVPPSPKPHPPPKSIPTPKPRPKPQKKAKPPVVSAALTLPPIVKPKKVPDPEKVTKLPRLPPPPKPAPPPEVATVDLKLEFPSISTEAEAKLTWNLVRRTERILSGGKRKRVDVETAGKTSLEHDGHEQERKLQKTPSSLVRSRQEYSANHDRLTRGTPPSGKKRSYKKSQPETDPSAHATVDSVITDNYFKGMEHLPPTIHNILLSLLRLLYAPPSISTWKERSEAVKAILYLYRTFSTDFRDVWSQVIAPQMDAMEDEAWQVRAQLSTSLGNYNVAHSEVVLALIYRLADKEDDVRKAALASLVELGVDSKRALASWMVTLGLVRADLQRGMEGTVLNESLKSHSQEVTALRRKSHQTVIEWLTHNRSDIVRTPAVDASDRASAFRKRERRAKGAARTGDTAAARQLQNRGGSRPSSATQTLVWPDQQRTVVVRM